MVIFDSNIRKVIFANSNKKLSINSLKRNTINI